MRFERAAQEYSEIRVRSRRRRGLRTDLHLYGAKRRHRLLRIHDVIAGYYLGAQWVVVSARLGNDELRFIRRRVADRDAERDVPLQRPERSGVRYGRSER